MSTTFRVLGCSGSESQGVRPCSFLLGDAVLFDASSVVATLSLAEQSKIRGIFLTHCHIDHIKDLGFLGENIFSGFSQPIEVFGHEGVLAAIKQHYFNNVIWPDLTQLPTVDNPLFAFKPISLEKTLAVPGLPEVRVDAIEVNHPGPTVGYVISGKKSALVYTGDTGPTEAIWQEVNRRPEVTDILLEASFSNRLGTLATQARHLTPEMLAGELKKITRPDVTIHIYHLKISYRDEIIKELEAIGDPRVKLLADNATFEIS